MGVSVSTMQKSLKVAFPFLQCCVPLFDELGSVVHTLYTIRTVVEA